MKITFLGLLVFVAVGLAAYAVYLTRQQPPEQGQQS